MSKLTLYADQVRKLTEYLDEDQANELLLEIEDKVLAGNAPIEGINAILDWVFKGDLFIEIIDDHTLSLVSDPDNKSDEFMKDDYRPWEDRLDCEDLDKTHAEELEFYCNQLV